MEQELESPNRGESELAAFEVAAEFLATFFDATFEENDGGNRLGVLGVAGALRPFILCINAREMVSILLILGLPLEPWQYERFLIAYRREDDRYPFAGRIESQEGSPAWRFDLFLPNDPEAIGEVLEQILLSAENDVDRLSLLTEMARGEYSFEDIAISVRDLGVTRAIA